MAQTDPKASGNGEAGLQALANELKQESERLAALAESLKAREKYLKEMEENYPYFKKAVYAMAKEWAEKELPPIPEDADLETYAREQGGLPLSAFIDDIFPRPDKKDASS